MKGFDVSPDSMNVAFQQQNDIDMIYYDLKRLLLTDPFERPFESGYGTGLSRLLFEPNLEFHAQNTINYLISNSTFAWQNNVEYKGLKVINIDYNKHSFELEVYITYKPTGQTIAFPITVE